MKFEKLDLKNCRGKTMTTRLLQLSIYMFLCNHSFISSLNSGNQPETAKANRSLPDIASLCPYNTFCRTPPQKVIPGANSEPCCEKCSCDLDCYQTGSCCPDMPLAGAVRPKYPCANLGDFAKPGSGPIPDKGSHLWYNVVTECSNNARALTNQKCYQPTEVQDFIIVSDPKSGRVYRNKYCAECNDVQDYVFWNLRADCSDNIHLLSLETFEERERYYMESCELLSLPPDRYAGDISRCIPDSKLITKCNSTGKWDLYDADIEEACMERREDQNSVFRNDPTRDEPVLYSSVYCYLCNVPSDSIKNDICTERGDDKEEKGGGILSFFVFIDQQIRTDNKEIQNYPCQSTEIWDPFMKFCRPLLCPSGKTPMYGLCKKNFSYLSGYTFAITFELIILEGNMGEPDERLLSILETRVFRELGNDLKCGQCSSYIYSETYNNITRFFKMELYSAADCRDDALLNRIRSIAVKEKILYTFKYQGQRIRISLRLTFENPTRDGPFELLLAKMHSMCVFIFRTIDSTIFQYCPHIKVTRKNAFLLGIGNAAKSSFKDVASENETISEFQLVCVDAYFHAQQIMSGAYSTQHGDGKTSYHAWFKLFFITVNAILMKI